MSKIRKKKRIENLLKSEEVKVKVMIEDEVFREGFIKSKDFEWFMKSVSLMRFNCTKENWDTREVTNE
jgi:disulfide oxidoreductase YuzD